MSFRAVVQPHDSLPRRTLRRAKSLRAKLLLAFSGNDKKESPGSSPRRGQVNRQVLPFFRDYFAAAVSAAATATSVCCWWFVTEPLKSSRRGLSSSSLMVSTVIV